jgi:CRP-like cAMP-binding protein
LYCILQGEADISIAGKVIDTFGPGKFIGEISLLTQTLPRADVTAKTSLRLIVWPHDHIEHWVGEDPVRLSFLQTALGRQVVEELLRQQSAAANPAMEAA